METHTNSSIRRTVLRRARFIRTVRPLLSGTMLGVVVIVAALYAIGREVWVARVIENMPSPANLFALLRFFEDAFLTTSFAVQVLTLVLVAGMYWIARDIALQVRIGTRTA